MFIHHPLLIIHSLFSKYTHKYSNISGDESQDFLAFGVTDELITGLQQLGDFPVVSRNASLSFGITEITATEFAQNHGASYMVEGSVNVGRDGIRILANLSSAQGNQVWAESYQLKGGDVDIFNISDEYLNCAVKIYKFPFII